MVTSLGGLTVLGVRAARAHRRAARRENHCAARGGNRSAARRGNHGAARRGNHSAARRGNHCAVCLVVLACGLASCGPETGPERSHVAAPAQPAIQSVSIPPPRQQPLPPEAESLVERLSDEFPGSVEALFARGQIVELYGQSDEAAWCWKQCQESDPNYAPACEQLGLLAAKGGDFAASADQLRRACELDPELSLVRLHLGKSLLKLGRHDEAARVLEEQARRQPGNPETWFQLGQAHLELEHYPRSRECYDVALRIDPDAVLAWFGMSQVLERTGDADAARQARERFVQLDRQLTARNREQRQSVAHLATADQRTLAQACSIAAGVHFAFGRMADAEPLWRRAADLDASNVTCRRAFARALIRENRLADAIGVLEDLHRLLPASVEPLLSQADLYQRLGKLPAAEERLRQALELAPDEPEAPASLARLFLATRTHLPEALALAERAVRLRPAAENYFLLSNAYLANENRSSARAALQEALRLDPKNPNYAQAATLLEN